MSNELQNKLKNYEATPSDKVWPAITAALEEKTNPAFDKLFEYEEEPNEAIWNKITQELDAAPTNKATILPMKNYFGKRFGIAAAAILILAVGITYFFTRQNSSAIINKQNNQTVAPLALKNDSGKNKQINALKTAEKNSEALKQTIEKENGENAIAFNTSKLAENRYTTMENEKGKVVRLSKKVIPVFDCAVNSNANNNADCKENIQHLQQKMAASFISTSADFGGLIDMLKDLKENNN